VAAGGQHRWGPTPRVVGVDRRSRVDFAWSVTKTHPRRGPPPGPDVVRLTRRLVADAGVPRGVRIWLVVLLVYLLSPIDLVPDFIPVIGYLDDAIVVALVLVLVLVLRFVTRHAGAAAIDRHWPGTEQGLSSLRAILGLRTT